jgi:hypothetical protein
MAVENQTLAPFYSSQRNPYNYSKMEQVDRDVVTPWLTLEEITQQLNLFDDESQDSYLKSLELATRMAIEDYLGMAIYPTTWKIYYPNFGLYNTAVFLDLPEVAVTAYNSVGVTIDAVEFYSTSNTVPVLIASSTYSYDPTGNRIILNTIPNTLNQNVANPIMVTYTQNSAFLATYPVIKQAALLLLTHLYNNRSNSTDGRLTDIPFGVSALLRSYKPLVM